MSDERISDFLKEIESVSTKTNHQERRYSVKVSGALILLAAMILSIVLVMLFTNILDIGSDVSAKFNRTILSDVNGSISFVVYSVLITCVLTLFYGFHIYYKLNKTRN